MSAAVKICGINSNAAFDAAFEAGADYLGFVFFPPSPRYVTAPQAAAFSARHVGGPKRVGLFVNPTAAEIEAVLGEVSLDILQIYGSASEVAAMRTRFAMPVWRALGVSSEQDFPVPNESVDGYVVEAKPPPGATRPGGNAVIADWDLLARWPGRGFWLLAGGLTPENVTAAIAQTAAPGVDVSSGVETAPGVKSPELIGKFVGSVKRF